MARYTGPKNRLARREGVDLGLKAGVALKLQRRLNVPPGQHGQRGKRKLSEYGLQMREKQKVKRMYSVLERQFARYMKYASQVKGATGEALLTLLERRLDNVVYRLQFAQTRAQARQFVSHGHILVNGKKVNIPSYLIKKDETISPSNKAMSNVLISKLLEDKNPVLPKWLERKASVGHVIRLPERNDIDVDINEQLIVEYYSR